MNFDQMLTTWQAQDEAPLYGVNADLLQLVLQNEQAKIRRTLRRDQWMTYSAGPGMALFAAFWLWVAILRGEPMLHIVAAGAGAAIFILWVGAFWLSRRRQARRERAFGNALQAEVRRNLSLVEYQIANGRWAAAMLWTAPVTLGALLLYWLIFQINSDTGFPAWNHVILVFCVAASVLVTAHAGDRDVKRKLEPRRQRLRDLLATLEAGE